MFNMIKFIALLKKELILAQRQKHLFLSLMLFSTLVIMFIYLGLEALGNRPPTLVPAIIWLVVVFGGTLQLNRTYDFERDEEVLDGIRLIPNTAMPFYLSKIVVNIVVLIALSVYAALISALLFNTPLLSELKNITAPMGLGLIGLASIGTTFSTMVMSHHKRDILLPTIFYPLIAPLSVAVIKAMQAGPGEAFPWMRILIAFDVIYVTASLMVFTKMMEE